MGGSHLVFGTTTDYITGQSLTDTHDERIRQQIARFLVEQKGYAKSDIECRVPLSLNVDGDFAVAMVDFVIRLENRAFAVIVYGPGSLVSRERAAVAAARLIENYVVPYTVVSNGEDAEVMDTATGKVVGEGRDAVFSKAQALSMLENMTFHTLDEKRRKKQERILFAMDVMTRRECESYVCRQC
ncbi:MAG: type I restriction enzyme HsdR N-terminal domain-containing protein [Thermodesulfobacteriota bacterium]